MRHQNLFHDPLDDFIIAPEDRCEDHPDETPELTPMASLYWRGIVVSCPECGATIAEYDEAEDIPDYRGVANIYRR